ncbi:hypothetical protein B0O99DRAFT_690120 [Bisporella sp. PMI_857]|nr:hypothetical protein B0O99DRAFT_690120 [Bisporella sp. PMI_857]
MRASIATALIWLLTLVSIAFKDSVNAVSIPKPTNYTSVADAFPQLLDLAAKRPKKNPKLGGRSGAYCCMLAVNESLQIQNGKLTFTPGQTVLRGNISTLEKFGFPCDRIYKDGSELDQPQVMITYDWCSEKCPGWQISVSKDLGQWARPMINFIAPSAVFVLSIPRRRQIKIPQQLLKRSMGSLSSTLALFLKIPLSSLIITADTIVWLLVVFTMSGPMVISGFYEAMLDKKILSFLNRRVRINSMSVRERAHLLFVVLLGNLDVNPAWDDCLGVIASLSTESPRRKSSGAGAVSLFSIKQATRVAGETQTRSSSVPNGDSQIGPVNTQSQAQSTPASEPTPSSQDISTVKSKIKSMMETQTGFGAAVGAAIVFYLASFCYAVVESQSLFGTSRPAHTIAFGTFWMVVPNVAIVSSLLLSGSNPSIWEAITGLAHPNQDEISRRLSSQLHSKPAQEKRAGTSQVTPRRLSSAKHTADSTFSAFFQPVYNRTSYRPAWLWNRGPCKAMWVAKFAEGNPRLAKAIGIEVQRMGFEGWAVYTWFSASLLIFVSYTTPRVGLSCRSMTFLTYACAQEWLMLLWLVKWKFWRRSSQGDVLPSTDHDMPILAEIAWYFAFSIGILSSIFSGVFGTFFWLVGFYRNCLCNVPIQYWIRRHSDETAAPFGGADKQNVGNAKQFWLPVGVFATAFMLFITYSGWWYQRQLRGHFQELVDKVDGINEEDMRENQDYIAP